MGSVLMRSDYGQYGGGHSCTRDHRESTSIAAGGAAVDLNLPQDDDVRGIVRTAVYDNGRSIQNLRCLVSPIPALCRNVTRGALFFGHPFPKLGICYLGTR